MATLVPVVFVTVEIVLEVDLVLVMVVYVDLSGDPTILVPSGGVSFGLAERKTKVMTHYVGVKGTWVPDLSGRWAVVTCIAVADLKATLCCIATPTKEIAGSFTLNGEKYDGHRHVLDTGGVTKGPKSDSPSGAGVGLTKVSCGTDSLSSLALKAGEPKGRLL